MGLLGFAGKWFLRLIIPAVIIAAIIFYLGQGLQEVSLERFDIDGITDITADSFIVEGKFFVDNPSEVSLPIKSIDYEVYLKETGKKIGSGSLPEFTLVKDSLNEIPFSQEIRWVPTAETAASLATKDKVIIEIKGEIRVDLPELEDYIIPFNQETDIKEYILQFAETPVDSPPVDGVVPEVPGSSDGDSGNDETGDDSNGIISDITEEGLV